MATSSAAKRVMLTRSYGIEVPTDTVEEVDGPVVSYWIPGKATLLQLSSMRRAAGDQVEAGQRLAERIASGDLRDVRTERLEIDKCPDVASASGLDEESTRWVYCYAVWPDLAVFLSVSGPPGELEADGTWAFDSVRSIRRTNWPQ